MKPKYWTLLFAMMALIGASSLFHSSPTANAQGTSGVARVAVSDDVNQHIHSMALRQQDVTTLIDNLGDNETANFTSSTGYNNGVPNGTSHEHQINLTKQQLTTLRDTGSVAVQSSEAEGHTHMFTFINQAQCPGAVATPMASASPSPSPSPSPSVSPSPSPSPSPSTSVSPTPSPSVSITIPSPISSILTGPTNIPTAVS